VTINWHFLVSIIVFTALLLGLHKVQQQKMIQCFDYLLCIDILMHISSNNHVICVVCSGISKYRDIDNIQVILKFWLFSVVHFMPKLEPTRWNHIPSNMGAMPIAYCAYLFRKIRHFWTHLTVKCAHFGWKIVGNPVPTQMRSNRISTEWFKKWEPVSFLLLTLSNINRFAKFWKRKKFPTRLT